MAQVYEQVGGLWAVQWDDGSRTTFETEAEAGMAVRDQAYIADVRGQVRGLWEAVNQLAAGHATNLARLL